MKQKEVMMKDPKSIRRIENRIGKAAKREHPANIGPAVSTFMANFLQNLGGTPEQQISGVGAICKDAIDLITKRALEDPTQ